jgi:hypothetical protein
VKIYTRHGDGGETGIWGGVRLAKDEARMEAIGTVDELNAAIGLAAAAVRDASCFDNEDPVPGLLGLVQHAGLQVHGVQRDDLGGDQPGRGQRQRGRDRGSFVLGAGFEHEHCAWPTGSPGVRQDTPSLKLAQRRAFGGHDPAEL